MTLHPQPTTKYEKTHYLELARLILDKGADPNVAENRGLTPLIMAARVGNTTAAKLLLERGANPAAYASGIGAITATPLMLAPRRTLISSSLTSESLISKIVGSL